MNEEKMMILAMLQEGKISVEEASKLIEALDEAERKEEQELNSKEFTEDNGFEDAHRLENQNLSDDWEEKLDKTISKLTKNLGTIGEKIEKKLNGDWKERLEETVEKLSEDITKKTIPTADRITEMIENFFEKGNLKGNFLGNYETKTEVLEKDISEIDSPILEFKAVNGKVTLLPWDKNKVFVKATCQVKKSTMNTNDVIYRIVESDNKISFEPKYFNNIGIKLDIYVPEKKYEEISITTTNGKIDLQKINSQKILCTTSNSSILLRDISGSKVEAITKNSKISGKNINSQLIKFSTTNSLIEAEHITSEEIKAITENSKVIFDSAHSKAIEISTSNGVVDLKDCKGELVKVNTSNAPIQVENIKTTDLRTIDLSTTNSKVYLSFADKSAYFNIDAKTSMGHIDIDFPVIYELNNQNQLGSKRIIAHTEATNEKQIDVKVLTSNGSIKIS